MRFDATCREMPRQRATAARRKPAAIIFQWRNRWRRRALALTPDEHSWRAGDQILALFNQ
ncbi:hypothetical protein PLANPX_2199 [Lacipirellula parvula]|uniref:Uncharacterized protein n=1 Tax=Lacipirellula parvula TaxID=2650471 RepID=A0A5K7X9M1_9BACT|nr:hypothetical protein PLANPX_2199 [Lacipirellula parvula]